MNKLYFKNIPNIYTLNEEVYLLGMDISGIQKYIFNITENKGSLKETKKRSLEISDLTKYLYNSIDDIYHLDESQIISLNSGKIIFILKKDIDINELLEVFNNLQRDVYLTYRGELNMYFGYVKANITNEKYQAQQTAYHSLLRDIQLRKRQSFNLLNYDHTTEFNKINLKIALKDGQLIDDLVNDDYKHQYVTGIKFDFDNLGAYFGKIGQSDEILKVSKIIKKKIEEVLNHTENIYKVFSGGDDIFVLVNFYQTFEQLTKIKEDLEKSFRDLDYEFGISAGVVVFKKQISIIYYGEKLEEALAHAKSSGKNGVSIEGHFFKWQDIISMKKYLNKTMSKLIMSRGSFLSPLANIESTLKSIMLEKEKDILIQKFILKIPLFLDKLSMIIQQSLLTYEPDKKDDYYLEIEKFYISIKYINRYLRKE